MNFFLLDASALVKRYDLEQGTPLVEHLFNVVARERLCCLMLGAAEVAAALVRKRNRGMLSPSMFVAAITRFSLEILRAFNFQKLPCDNSRIEASIPWSDLYALNSHDAVVLQTALDHAVSLRTQGNDLVLVAADTRLLRAAQAEGLHTFNPETQTQAELDALIAV
jgi:predicted nucleic acid-binding protein